jgi:Rad3-related DNA helicase
LRYRKNLRQYLTAMHIPHLEFVSNPKNWIVSEIKKEGYEVTGVQLKPLDVSPYCKGVFEKCDKTLTMSATILDSKTFCQSLGLAYDEVKLIHVG